MKRLIVVCPSVSDATSLYRGVGPLGRLQRDMPDLNLLFVSRYEWSTLTLADAIFLQRPYSSDHLKIASMAESAGIPIWVDYDDDLFAVPIENKCHPVYSPESTKKTIATICAMASVITVSTKALGDKLARLNKNIVVVPNALDDDRFSFREKRVNPREKKVFYRGSDTHSLDLQSVASQLVEVSNSKEANDWRFEFLGFNPSWITNSMPNGRTGVGLALDPIDYMRYLNKINPALMIFPLVDSVFNRSKSNICWIEAMYCGATLIAPNLPEFQRQGVLLYNTPEEFGQRLRDAIAGKYNLESINANGWKQVLATTTLTQVNPLRAKIMEELCRKSSRLA